MRCQLATVFSWNAKTYSDLTLLRDIFFTGWLLLHRPGTAPPRSVMAVLAPRREAMCFSSRRLSSLPSLSQRWADAASILHGVCSHDYTFQPLPLRSVPMVPTLACQGVLGVVSTHASGSCGACGNGAGAARGGLGERLIRRSITWTLGRIATALMAAPSLRPPISSSSRPWFGINASRSLYRRVGRLWSSSCSPH